VKFWKKSLMAQLVGYFLILSLLTWGLGIYVAYTQARQALEDSLFDRLAASATLKEDELNRWVEDQRQVMASVAQLPELQSQAEQLLTAQRDGQPLDSSIYSAEFSADGRWIVTGGADYTVRIWDATTGAEVTRLRQDDWAYAYYTPDGRWLTTNTRDNFLRIWDPAGQAIIHELPHQSELNEWNFSPDGQLVATGPIDGTIHLWDINSGQELMELSAEEMSWAYWLEFSPDSGRLAVAGDDFVAHIWDVATGEELLQLEHDGEVFAALFSPDGQQVVSASQDGTAVVWSADSGEPIATLAHDSAVNKASFTPNGQWVVTASDDSTARVWDAATGQQRHELVHEAPVKLITISPDSQWLATASGEGRARLWEIATGREVPGLEFFDVSDINLVHALDFSPDSQRLVTSSWDGLARVWEVSTGRELLRLQHDSLTYASLNRTLTTLAAGKPDLDTVFLLNIEGEAVVSTDLSQLGNAYAEAAYFSQGVQEPTVQNLYPEPTSGRPMMTIAVPVTGDDGEAIGVLAAHLDLDRMDVILNERTGMGETGTTYLVTSNNQHVNGEQYGAEQLQSQGITQAIEGIDDSSLYTNYAGVPVVGVYRWLNDRGVALIAEIEQREAFAPARGLAWTMLAVGLFFAAVLAVGVYLVAYQISRPILAISDAAAAVEAETFQADSLTVIGQREDELGVLARVFKHMAEQVYAREQKLKQEVVELRIQIDESKRNQQVDEITQSDYFRDLQARAKSMRTAGAEREE
jgi:WD40 repeat protein/HAMP domain-containing protein